MAKRIESLNKLFVYKHIATGLYLHATGWEGEADLKLTKDIGVDNIIAEEWYNAIEGMDEEVKGWLKETLVEHGKENIECHLEDFQKIQVKITELV